MTVPGLRLMVPLQSRISVFGAAGGGLLQLPVPLLGQSTQAGKQWGRPRRIRRGRGLVLSALTILQHSRGRPRLRDWPRSERRHRQDHVLPVLGGAFHGK